MLIKYCFDKMYYALVSSNASQHFLSYQEGVFETSAFLTQPVNLAYPKIIILFLSCGLDSIFKLPYSEQ